MIGLKRSNSISRCRSEHAIDWSGVITVLLQLRLHVHYHLIRRQTVVGVDRAVIRIIRSWEITQRRKPKTSVKEESVVIDYDDPEVLSPPVTIMKFVTMHVRRLGKTYPIRQASVPINRHVSLIKCANAVHPHIVPVNGRAHTLLRRHGTAWMKARSRHIATRSHSAHRRPCICRGSRVHIRPRPRSYAGIRCAPHFLTLRR